MEVKPWFRNLQSKKCPIPLNKKDYVNIFQEQVFVSPEWRCLKGEVPLLLNFGDVK